ncbi:hypothetical protein OHA19_44340 (plasmid) [Streptomyces sp. NBC_00012]|uniref:hypothetical protein n=1 Tax=Streptomyces sp. NBC_00012 TaxID=2975621 RepID=UPI002F914375
MPNQTVRQNLTPDEIGNQNAPPEPPHASSKTHSPELTHHQKRHPLSAEKKLDSESVNPFIPNPKVRQNQTLLFSGISTDPLLVSPDKHESPLLAGDFRCATTEKG